MKISHKAEEILTYKFVEYIPSNLKDKTVYVSTTFATVVHRCCCGCGNEVVTPLSPTDWKLIFDGESISLDPSIGNWSFDCKSHYWIRHNKVIWATQWSREKIDTGRVHDRAAKERYFASADVPTNSSDKEKQGLWVRLKNWWLQRGG